MWAFSPLLYEDRRTWILKITPEEIKMNPKLSHLAFLKSLLWIFVIFAWGKWFWIHEYSIRAYFCWLKIREKWARIDPEINLFYFLSQFIRFSDFCAKIIGHKYSVFYIGFCPKLIFCEAWPLCIFLVKSNHLRSFWFFLYERREE